MTRAAYPLTWPERQRRTAPGQRREARFQVDLVTARDALLRGLNLLGARDVIVATDVPPGRNGVIVTGHAEPRDPGVAVYFERMREGKRVPFAVACDTYSRVRHNLRAVGVTIDALRAIQRHGASEMLEQAFTGFAALPPINMGPDWWTVLEVYAHASTAEIRDAYRRLAAIHHPDVGGDPLRMTAINVARDKTLATRGAAS